MGIRDKLGRATRLCLGVAVLGWCIFVACLFMPMPPAWLMIASFVATCGAMVAMLVTIRCPQCRSRLPQIGFAAALAPSTARRFERCPACGLRFD